VPGKILFFISFLLLAPNLLKSQNNFVVRDVLAADESASIIDPEYNMALKIVCWQSDDKDLWVCSLDPVTRLFSPPDGKGTLVDHDLTPPTFGGWNGPEWMLSQGCTQIVYNQKKGGIRYPGLATQFLGGWLSSTLMEYPGTLYAMATRNYADSTSMFLYESESNDGIRWVRNTELTKCNYYPGITLGFFADDKQQICCAMDHSRQPGFVEVQTTLPYFTQISNDTIGAPAMWIDPETDSRMFMYRTNGSKTLKIFQENSDGNWYLYHSFNSPLPSPYDYITSPEPFKFGGRSYISFMAAQSTMGLAEMPAQIWIASVNPNEPMMRRVSDSTEALRMDPEPVIFGDSAFIYYTEKVYTHWWQLLHRVRKCDTGLENYYTAVKEKEGTENTLSILPNPSHGKITVSSEILQKNRNADIRIFDNSGRLLRTYKSGGVNNSFDPGLPPGLYILKVTGGNASASSKLLVL
jgi:hypothetical protein